MNRQRTAKIKDAASRNGRPQRGHVDAGRKAEDVARLEGLVESLLTTPPENVEALESEYKHIRELIERIEKDNGHVELLSSLDNDFQRVRRTYSYLSPGFLSEVGSSLLATEYRFFVGGLQIYLKQLKEQLSNFLQPA